MRAIWKGSLSFGLVNIPVRLYGASAERALNFRLLDKHDLRPVRYQKVTRTDSKAITKKDVVRGYEVDGEFVVLSDDEIKRVDARKAETIDIVQFTDAKHINPEYYEKPYYIEPQKKFSKAYALLRDALQKSGKVGVVRYVLREKEYIGALMTDGPVLVLEQLRYLDEMRNPRDLDLPQRRGYSEAEMEIALAFIDSRSRPFDPREFKDTYTEALHKLIAEKRSGKKIKTRAAAPPIQATNMADILATLRESLERLPEHIR